MNWLRKLELLCCGENNVRLQISQTGGEIALFQATYVRSVVSENKITNKTTTTPINSKKAKVIVKRNITGTPVNSTDYKSIVGQVMYASVGTKPNIVHTIGFLRCYAATPDTSHMEATQHLLSYLNTFPDMQLIYCWQPAYHSNCNHTTKEWDGMWYSFKLKETAFNAIVCKLLIYHYLFEIIVGLYKKRILGILFFSSNCK